MQDIKINDQTPHCSKHVLPLVVGGLTITCEDNMELMARYPDNYFDLAIVDPPYGIGMDGKNNCGGNLKGNIWKNKKGSFDNNPPNKEYFKELKRVSKNQIIWGVNHFSDIFNFKSSCYLVWVKGRGFSFADAEIAYSSFNTAVRVFDYHNSKQNTYTKGTRIHPTQKPIALYKWILDKYAKQGDKILDTHLGSGSIAIACHDYKFELTACELDPEYFNKAKQRIINHVAQQSLF